MNALTRRQAHLRSGRNGVGSAIAVDGHVGFAVDGLVGQTVVDADQDVAAAAIDNILRFIPMEMIRGILPLFHVEQFLSVDFRVLVLHGAVAVADGDKRHTDLVKVAKTVIGNIPAKHTVTDFVIFMSF